MHGQTERAPDLQKFGPHGLEHWQDTSFVRYNTQALDSLGDSEISAWDYIGHDRITKIGCHGGCSRTSAQHWTGFQPIHPEIYRQLHVQLGLNLHTQRRVCTTAPSSLSA